MLLVALHLPRDRGLDLDGSSQEITGPADELDRHLPRWRHQRLERRGPLGGPCPELLLSKDQVGFEDVEHLDPVVHIRGDLVPFERVWRVAVDVGGSGVTPSITSRADSRTLMAGGNHRWALRGGSRSPQAAMSRPSQNSWAPVIVVESSHDWPRESSAPGSSPGAGGRIP